MSVAVYINRFRGFCKVLVDGRELSYHAKVVLMAKSRLTGRSIRVMIMLSKWQGPGRQKSIPIRQLADGTTCPVKREVVFCSKI